MTLPSFYDPSPIGGLCRPNIKAAVEAGIALQSPAARSYNPSAARGGQPDNLRKCSIPKTAHYSILEPKVKVDDHPQGRRDHRLLNELSNYDLVNFAGQAKSHCVLETANSIMPAWKPRPAQTERLRVLDAVSSVVAPGLDFDALAKAQYQRRQANGLSFADTTHEIG